MNIARSRRIRVAIIRVEGEEIVRSLAIDLYNRIRSIILILNLLDERIEVGEYYI